MQFHRKKQNISTALLHHNKFFIDGNKRIIYIYRKMHLSTGGKIFS